MTTNVFHDSAHQDRHERAAAMMIARQYLYDLQLAANAQYWHQLRKREHEREEQGSRSRDTE